MKEAIGCQMKSALVIRSAARHPLQRFVPGPCIPLMGHVRVNQVFQATETIRKWVNGVSYLPVQCRSNVMALGRNIVKRP